MSKINSSAELFSPEDPAAVPARHDRVHRDLSTATIAFHEAVSRRLGMTAAERKTLGLLGEMGVATPGQLAAATGLTTGAITGIVDRLEKAGYARRAPNPDDRRSLLIHALQVDKVREMVAPIFGSLGAAMTELTSTYTSEQLELIQDYLLKTTEVLRAEARKLRE